MGDRDESGNRRSGKDRRDWDEFVIHDRRNGKERRAHENRRHQHEAFEGLEKRKSSHAQEPPPGPSNRVTGKRTAKKPAAKAFYTTSEAAAQTGISQATLTLWIRNNVIDDSKIKRDPSGRRMWTQDNLEMVRKIKKKEGWR